MNLFIILLTFTISAIFLIIIIRGNEQTKGVENNNFEKPARLKYCSSSLGEYYLRKKKVEKNREDKTIIP
jgi:hypothetical protein